LIWTLQNAGELARYSCELCGGTGVGSSAPDSPIVPCACTFRRVFRACYRRFRQCAESDGSARRVSFGESRQGVDRHLVWIRRSEDYCADFQSAGRRSLTPELYRIFRFYHLLGGSAELVARRLGLCDRDFFRILREVESTVGREMALMEPYSLYPPRGYMTRVAVSRIA
jgi:hypothetical protein